MNFNNHFNYKISFVKEAAQLFTFAEEDKDQDRKGIAICDHIKVNCIEIRISQFVIVSPEINEGDRKVQSSCYRWHSWLLSWYEYASAKILCSFLR